MLHKVFLTFVIPEIEQQYRLNYQPYMINEYKTLTSLILVMNTSKQFVQTFVFLAFITYEQYYYALYTCIGAIFIMISRSFIEKYPKISNFVYPFLQICVAIIFNLLCYNQPQSRMQDLFNRYEWYYGFFAAISHICIYSQGTILCFQTVTMALILGWHVSRFDFSNADGAFVTCQIVIVFAVIFLWRRDQERNKRMSYLRYRENMKWYEILDKIVKKVTMFVQFDKSSDQLSLVQQSKAASQQFQLKDDLQFRKFLRHVYIEQTCSLKTQSGQTTLEDILRQLLSSGVNQSEVRLLTDKLYYKHIGYYKAFGKYFQFKLVEYYMSDKKMVVMIIQPDKQKLTEEQKTHQYVDDIFKSAVIKSVLLIEKILLVAKPHQLKLYKLFDEYNFFHILHIWLNPTRYIITKETVLLSQIELQLKKIFRKQLQITIKTISTEFISSYQVILFICVNIIKLLQGITKQTVELKIMESEIHDTRCLEFQFRSQNLKLNKQFSHLMQENKYFNRSKQSDVMCFRTITQSYINFHDTMAFNQQSCLGMAVIKYLLLHFGMNNQIECHKDYIKLCFMDLNGFTL